MFCIPGIRAIGLLALFTYASLAWAEPVCPQGPPLPGEALTAHANRLQRLEPRCDHDPGFLAWYGAVLLDLGRPHEAADVLERALLLDPGHQGARLDYARALTALGEAQAARELAREVAQRPDAPSAVLDFLDSFLPPAPGWQVRGALSLRAGHDDNLNRATRATGLALSLPGGEVLLPLEPSARARAGGFVDASAELHAWGDTGAASTMEFMASARARRAGGQDHQEQLDALVHLSWPQGEAAWAALAGMSDFRWQGGTLRRTWRLGLRRSLAGEGCRPWLGLDLEVRRHPAQPLLDHRAWHGHGGWVCDGAEPWALQLAAGREIDAARPGSEATRLAARLYAMRYLADGSRLEGEVQLGQRREDGPYSPWLEGGARLAFTTFWLRLDWRRPLGRGWEAMLGMELERQNANLPLYSIRRRALSAGLAWRW